MPIRRCFLSEDYHAAAVRSPPVIDELHLNEQANLRRGPQDRDVASRLRAPFRQVTFPNAGPADGVDVAWLLRTIRSVAPDKRRGRPGDRDRAHVSSCSPSATRA